MLVALASLTACTTTTIGEPEPVATTSAPVFASDEEALAAAEKAYAAYTEMSDLIASEGGVDPERIEHLASGDVLEGVLATFERFRDESLTLKGETTFDSLVLQRQDSLEVVAYLCLDVTNVDVVNEAGETTVSPDRRDRLPFEVTFEVAGGQLIPANRQLWQSGSKC
ncbi:hypothetical protein DDQ50_08495 [Amnibacterium flavum]|uniref:Nuclear transport factor 2 family protein n=1 Tax=Amnibacterium flavum TaxID=2173173 RepID=A0A2V1HU39_9MICO|nr:hypothetical protein DDQ50_08495 [Amnibacterium flavum]